MQKRTEPGSSGSGARFSVTPGPSFISPKQERSVQPVVLQRAEEYH